MSDYAEGQTATNPSTGARIVFRGGAWHNATATDAGNTDTIVKALVDGRMSFPTDSRALNKPYWQNLLAKVSERDPSFDTIDYKARARTRQDFTSGKSAQNITSFNTLLHHIGTLQKAADELDNFGGVGTLLNRPANAILESSGSARPTNFRQAKLAVVGEAVRAFRGVGGARGDIEEAAEAIPENGSPEQIRGSIKTLASLLEGRIKSLGEQYSAGMGKTSNGINLLDEDARKTLERLGIGQSDDRNGAAGAGGSAPPPAGPNGTPPTFDGSTTELVRGDQAQGQPAPDYTPEQRAAIAAVARTGTGEQLKSLLSSFGRSYTGSDADLAKVLAFYRDPKNANRAVNLPAPTNAVVLNDGEKQEVAQFVEGSDAAGAGMAGIANGTSLSFLDEAGAAAEAAFGSGEGSFVDRYDRRLAVNRAKLDGLRDDHGGAFVAGEVLGSLPLGFGQFADAQAAARAAGVTALRGGATGAEARVAALKVLAARNAIEGAGLAGAYCAGAANGGIGDRAGSAVIGAVAGGLMAGGGTLAGGRFARVMAERRGTAGPAAAPTEAQLFGEAAQRRGVDYLPADVPDATATRMVSGVANMSLAGIPMSEAANRALASANRAKGVVADRIGVVGDTTQAGQAAQRGANAFIGATEAKANSFYDAIPIASGTNATIGNTRRTLADLTAGLESNPELSALVEDPRLKAFEAAFAGRTEAVPTGLLDGAGNAITRDVQRGGALSWQDLKAFRTYIGERLGGPQLQSDTSRNALKALYGALSSDMEATAAAQGPAALKAFNRANSYYRGRQDRIESVLSAVLGDDLAKSPDAAYRALEALASKRGGDPGKYARLMRSLPEDDANAIRATTLDRLGLASAGRQDATQRVYSPTEFMTQWSKLSDRAKAVLFTGEHRQAVDDLVRIADGMKGSTKYANTSKTSLGG